MSLFVFFSSLSALVSCDVKTPLSVVAEEGSQVSSARPESAMGTWYDEDQLLLIGVTEESREVVVGYDLVPSTVVREREEEGQRIYGWMILKNKRLLTETSYALESNCQTHEGEQASLKLLSAVVFEADKALFKIAEDEKSVYQKLGEFDCVVSLPGFTTRKYQLSPDQLYLSLFEENSSEELIKLKRGN